MAPPKFKMWQAKNVAVDPWKGRDQEFVVFFKNPKFTKPDGKTNKYMHDTELQHANSIIKNGIDYKKSKVSYSFGNWFNRFNLKDFKENALFWRPPNITIVVQIPRNVIEKEDGSWVTYRPVPPEWIVGVYSYDKNDIL